MDTSSSYLSLNLTPTQKKALYQVTLVPEFSIESPFWTSPLNNFLLPEDVILNYYFRGENKNLQIQPKKPIQEWYDNLLEKAKIVDYSDLPVLETPIALSSKPIKEEEEKLTSGYGPELSQQMPETRSITCKLSQTELKKIAQEYKTWLKSYSIDPEHTRLKNMIRSKLLEIYRVPQKNQDVRRCVTVILPSITS